MNFSTRLKKSFKEALGVLMIAGLSGVIFNSFSDNGIPLIAQPRELKQASDSLLNAAADTFQIPADGFEEPLVITLEQAYELYISKKALFIDARKKDFYEMGHIKGAINLPWLGPEKKARIPDTLSKKQLIVTYCEGECDSAIELAYFLFENEYYFIHIFHDGFEDWENAEYPSE